MESYANDIFAQFAMLYFDKCETSVYFQDIEFEGFNALFLVRKELKDEKGVKEGYWNSVHQVTASVESKRVKYRLVSQCSLYLRTQLIEEYGEIEISSSLIR